jgi:transcriptional regulator with XRE-family HTH domain/Zn-dependent peptidase ImmA (M78 family)
VASAKATAPSTGPSAKAKSRRAKGDARRVEAFGPSSQKELNPDLRRRRVVARGNPAGLTEPTVLGEALRAARSKREWTLRDVADRAGFNSGYLSLIERGEVKQPRPHIIRRLADAYGEPFELLMTWAGYVEDDPAGLSPNQRRALSLLGDDPREDELEALEMILEMLRKNRSASFASPYGLHLPSNDREQIRTAVCATLAEADAIGRFPTPLDDIYAVAELVDADEVELTPADRRALRERFGELANRMLRKLQGVIDFRTDEVWVNPDLHPMKQRFVKAHEAGHKVLTWQRDTFAFLDDRRRLRPDVRDLYECQANEAAVEFLAQAGRLREEADDDNPPTLRTVQSLSAKYGMSLQATARYIAERSQRTCACAISFKSSDGILMPFHLFSSTPFEKRFAWRAGRAPRLQLDAVLMSRSMFEEREPTQCVDVTGAQVSLQTGVLHTKQAVIGVFGCESRRFLRADVSSRQPASAW